MSKSISQPPSRSVDLHRPGVPTLNDQLTIEVLDVQDPVDGCNRVYRIAGFNTGAHPALNLFLSEPVARATAVDLLFMDGSPKHPNGITIEALLAVAIDHMTGLAGGPKGTKLDRETLAALQRVLALRAARIREEIDEGQDLLR